MRPPKVAFIAPREVSRMANDVFFGIWVAGYSAFFTRSDEGYYLSFTSLLPVRSLKTGRARVPILQPRNPLLCDLFSTRLHSAAVSMFQTFFQQANTDGSILS